MSGELVRAEATRLPALIDRARQTLAGARTSAEVLEGKALADAALHHAKLTKATAETQADCLRMIVRAEIRLASEIDHGQERGDLADGRGRPQKASSTPTLSDIGVRRDELHDWRKTRDAGETVVEQAIDSAITEGRAPTKADIRRAAAHRGPRARTKAQRSAQRARIEAMAADGYTSEQIAQAIGIDVKGLRVKLQKQRIGIPADRVIGRTRAHNTNRILASMAMDAENLTADIGLIDYTQADPNQLDTWIATFRGCRDRLGTIVNRLRKEKESRS